MGLGEKRLRRYRRRESTPNREEADEVVDDPWREPADHVEPLKGAAHGKLRIGPFRLGCRVDREANVLWILRIRRCGGDAYRGDD
jgi:mRNA interferase RelE/StbE